MTTLKDVKKVAASYGATVEVDDYGCQRVIHVDLPKGTRWAADQWHCLTCTVTKGVSGVSEEYDDLIDRMSKYGVEKCLDSECDICHPI